MPLLTSSHTEVERKAMIAAGINPDDVEPEAINTDDFEDIDGSEYEDAPAPAFSIQPKMSPTPFIDSLSRVNKLSVEPKPVVDYSAPSEIGSFARQAAANVAPSTAAFGAGVIGGELGAPFIPPFGSIVGSLVTAIPAYLAAKKAQDVLLPQTWLDTLKRDTEVNPKSSLAGSILGQSPTMRISPTSIRDVIKGVPNLVKSQATPAEVKAIGNTILGGGIGAATGAAQDIPDYASGKITGWDLTKDIATSSILNALQNRQTKLGEGIAKGGKNIVDALRFKINPNTTYVPPEPPIIDEYQAKAKAAEKPIVEKPVIDVEGTVVKPEPKQLTFHTPETEAAMVEAKAKIAKTQEETAKMQEETAKISEEHRVANESKEKAAQDLIQASKGDTEVVKPTVVEPMPVIQAPGAQAEPTPGTFQSIKKYGNDKDEKRNIEAVRNGTKPVVLTPRFKTPDDLTETQLSSGHIVISKGPLESSFQAKLSQNLSSPNSLEKSAELGKLLGYTDAEIQEFKDLYNQVVEPAKPKTISERPFITTTEREISDPSNPLKFTKFKDGGIDARTVGPRLKNRLTASEWKSLQNAGIEEFLGKQINVKPEELQKWIEENSLKVNQYAYGMEGDEKVSEAKMQHADLIHTFYDIHQVGIRNSIDRAVREAKRSGVNNNADYNSYVNRAVDDYDGPLKPSEFRKQVENFVDVSVKVLNEPKDTSLKATQYLKQVSAFDTTKSMPDFTTSKYASNMQEVTVNLPSKKDLQDEFDAKYGNDWSGKDLDEKDAKRWKKSADLRATNNIHAQQPNQVGRAEVQYVEGPNGEKIAALSEVQSDWDQDQNAKVKRIDEELKRALTHVKKTREGHVNVDNDEYLKSIDEEIQRKIDRAQEDKNRGDHPALEHATAITLKAVISQALKENATYVFIPSGTTGMLTEAHDHPRNIIAPDNEVNRKHLLENGITINSKNSLFYGDEDTKKSKIGQILHVGQIEDKKIILNHSDVRHITNTFPDRRIKQQKGMNLHYDVTLPSIMKKLLGGQEGVKISLGEHKNALGKPPRNNDWSDSPSFKSIEEVNQWAKDNHVMNVEIKEDIPGVSWYAKYNGVYRPDLFLKNPDGTFQTDVQGLLFDITGVDASKPFDLFSLASLVPASAKIQAAPKVVKAPKVKYPPPALVEVSKVTSQTETPAFKKWFGNSKVVDEDGKPLVVYHGTTWPHVSETADGERIKPDDFYYNMTQPIKIFEGSREDDGAITFVKTPESAAQWGDKIYPVYLSFKNPLVENYGGKDARDATAYNLVKRAKAGGHDSAILHNVSDKGGYHASKPIVDTQYFAFYHGQIKSIFEEVYPVPSIVKSPGLPIKSPNFTHTSSDEPNFTRVEPVYNAPALVEKPGPLDTIPQASEALSDDSSSALVKANLPTAHNTGYPVNMGAGANRGLPPAIPPPGHGSSGIPPIIPPSIPPIDDPYAPEKNDSRQGFLKGGAPQFDKIRRLNVPVAEAFHNAKVDGDSLIGRFVNVPINKLMKLSPSAKEMEHTMKEMNKAYRDSVIRGIPPKIDLGLSTKEEAIRAIITDVNMSIPVEAKRRDMKINGRFTADKPNVNYIQAKVNPEILHIINKNPDGVEARRYARLYANYIQDNFPKEFPKTAQGYEKARKEWTDYLSAINGDKSYASVDFGPLHKAQGYGLPEEMQDWNLPRVITNYGNSVAHDMAFHTNMKSVPEVAGPLKLRHKGSGKLVVEDERYTDISGTPEVQGGFKMLSSDFNYGNPELAAATRMVTSHMIGFMTGVGDLSTTPMNMLPYMDKMGSDIVSSVKGLINIRDAYRRSLATNARQRRLDTRLWGNMEHPGRPLATLMNKEADIMRIIQLREMTDQLSKIIPFAAGREMAKVRIMDYVKTGNKDSLAWLKKFGRNVEGGIDKIDPASGLINEQLDQIAKNFADRVSASYSGDQLPVYVMDGEAAPFMTLSKWSIAKANVAFQDILKPAYTKQQYGPLLRYMLGMFGSYALYTTLQELLTHKKSKEATLRETLAKGNKADMVAYLANMMSVSSFFGIASYPIKAMTDMGIKHQFPPNYSLNNPLLEFAGENVLKNFMDASEAIAEGEDPLRTIGNAVMQMFKNSTQNLRMIGNQTWNRENAERADKVRDLAVFNALGDAADNPERSNVKRAVGIASNPLLKPDEKEFKRATDLDKAREMIPDLLKKIEREAQGDDEKRLNLLRGLMKDSYPTFPSMHSSKESAKQAVEYTKYLIEVYGRDEARERLLDFMKHGRLHDSKKTMLMQESMKER